LLVLLANLSNSMLLLDSQIYSLKTILTVVQLSAFRSTSCKRTVSPEEIFVNLIFDLIPHDCGICMVEVSEPESLHPHFWYRILAI
jgi:hypothetical protein